MTDNKKLIEEAAKAIRDAHAESRGYLAESPPHYSDSELYARIALVVFEKALTPTDDELRDAIEHIEGAVEFQDAINSEAVRVVIEAARRSEVPEPSTGQVNDVLVLLEDAIDNIDYPGADTLEWIGKAKAHAATLARWARPEPQGEPSDAQVDAASREIDLRGFHIPPMAVRAALRAAGVVGQEGESRG